MRRHLLTRPLLTAGVALATVLTIGAANGRADVDVKFPNKSKVEKAVEKLVGGEIDYTKSREREETLNEIDGYLQKDSKGVALRTPAFWVEAMQNGYFGKRKGWKSGRLTEEKIQFAYADGSAGDATIAYAGAKLGNDPATLVVTLLPKGTNPKEWLEQNWQANDTALAGWHVAAIAMSDKFPVAEQPHLLAYVFGTVRSNFNCDANRWFLEGVGDACAAAQKAAAQSLPDRLAGLILRDPKAAALNENAKFFHTVVLASGATSEVATKLAETLPNSTTAIAAGDDQIAQLVEWMKSHPGRSLRSSYSFSTDTTEDRVLAPVAGAVYLSSPAKRGTPISMTVAFDKASNTVTLDGDNLGEFKLMMNDEFTDLDKPVKIVCNGEILEEGRKFERSLKEIFEIADQFGEYGRVFTASYIGHAPSKAADAEAEAGPEKKDGE